MCVRLTDLRGVDLDTFAFDYDQTFALLLLHADGTVLHRFGSRDAASATSAIGEPALLRLLRDGLATHAAHQPVPAGERAPRTLDDEPAWQRKVAERERKGQPIGCYHCHFVYDAELVGGRDRGTWREESIWRWPEPRRVGLSLDRDQQDLIAAVDSGSPAARAGLQAGDRLTRLGAQRVLSWNDVAWVLERARGHAASVPVAFARDGAARESTLELAPGFEVATYRELAWRPSKWMLRPTPGFGGADLEPAERAALGLPADGLAFRVTYFADWNDEAPFAAAARAAGVRPGDVVTGVAGASPVRHEELHAWWRLTRKAGDEVRLTVLRAGARLELALRVP